MSRLTDQDLDKLIRLNRERVDDSIVSSSYTSAWEVLQLAIELRERRRADLTGAHIDGLRFCVDNVWDDAEGRHPECVKLAREALDKLLAREVSK